MYKILVIINCLSIVFVAEAARILVVVPTPSIGHQLAFRPFTQELAKRGHDVTIITTDPAFPKGETPNNLTEIDLHDMSYKMWNDFVFNSEVTSGKNDDVYEQMKNMYKLVTKIFEKQVQHPEIKKILSNEKQFDLLIIEAWIRSPMLFTHVVKNVPVIAFSSFIGGGGIYDIMGVPSRPPLLYPTYLRQKIVNLSISEKLGELYSHYVFDSMFTDQDVIDDKSFKKILGPETPDLKELDKNIDMLFLNVHPIWELNRPVPPSVVYLGGVHQLPEQKLPRDLQEYLDSSKHGVIYISYGTNIRPSLLPPEKIQMLVNVFSRLSYDVVWKWDTDELPGRTKNIRISKWLPQSDLLKHPKIKLFVTQGGLQSTDEAITAGVPLIGMPMLGDQWYNVEHYTLHQIGIRVDLGTMTEEEFENAVKTVISDGSYRKNMEKLRKIMYDQPQSALDRAVWWTEHLLRHGGGKHLRAPAANMTWAEYLDVELLAVLGLAALFVVVVGLVVLYTVMKWLKKVFVSEKLKKS